MASSVYDCASYDSVQLKNYFLSIYRKETEPLYHYFMYRIYSRIRRKILDKILTFFRPFDLYAGH